MITFEILLVIVITVGIFVLFATEKFTVDFIALSTIVILMLTGLVTPQEGISGFANPATITILAMFIISEGIQKSGLVHVLGEKILWLTKTLTRQMGAISLISVLGGVINNTASVTILSPMIMDLANKTKTYATQLLIPLSYVSMAAGTLTLIGTSTNLLANNIYVRAGFDPIGIFEITKLGIFVFLIVSAYFLTIGRYLLPKREGHTDITDPYTKMKYNADAILPPESALAGQKVKNCKLNDYDIEIFSISREGKVYRRDLEKFEIKPDDVLAVYGSRLKLLQADSEGLIQLESGAKSERKEEDLTLDQFMVSENASIINQTINSIGFKDRFNASVLAMKRGKTRIKRGINSTRLRYGDILLLKATQDVIDVMKMSDEFVYIGELTGPYRLSRMKYAISILLLVIILAAFEIVPIMVAALTGVILMVLFGVVTLSEGYRAVNWRVIFLLAGVIPLGIALQNTGAVQIIADYIVTVAEYVHPVILLGILYLITSVVTEMISNNAAVIILAPIALSTATVLGYNPFTFLVVVMFAASTSFLTPIGYQTNTIVYTIGNYKFTDFTKVGLPLNLILLVTTTTLAVLIWGL